MTDTMTSGRLEVDFDHGLVLRADDRVRCTLIFLNTHPYIYHALDGSYFVGPQAFLAAKLRSTERSTRGLRVIEYQPVFTAADGGMVELQKVVDE